MAESASPFGDVRAQIVEGRLGPARDSLQAQDARDLSPADRAVVAELRYLVTTWDAFGGVPDPVADVAVPASVIHDSASWDRAFAPARATLVRGRYAEAVRRFEPLRAAAPDATRRAMASELGSLANDLLRKPRPVWYGRNMLIVDGISLLTSPILLGVLVYPFGAPIIHLKHGRPAVAALSFGTRVAAPIAGVGLFIALGGKTESSNSGEFLSLPSVGVLASGFLPAIGAMIFDAAVLAYEPPAPQIATAAPSRSIFPYGVARTGGDFELGIGGTL